MDLARALPEGWAAGVVRPGRAAQIVPAAADVGGKGWVLVVVDDADSEPAADIAALLRHVDAAQQVPVRVLLVVRDADAFGTVLDEHLPAVAWESTTLSAVGVDDDRRRIFADAVRAFSGRSDDAPPPPWAVVERGPVGADGEPMAVTQARAALAVLAEDPDHALAMRTADLEQLTDAIRTHEKKRWNTAAVEADAQEEAVLALLLRGPRHIEDAVAALQTLPRFRDRDVDDVRGIASRARLLYPGAPDEPWLDPRPDLLRGALLAMAVDRHRSLVLAALDDDPRLFLRIARATACLPHIRGSLRALLTDDRLVSVIEATVLADGLSLRTELVEALADRALAGPDVERLLPITESPMWAPLRVALRRAEVRHLREATADDVHPHLARALADLGSALRDTGAHADALGPTREAVQLYRDHAAAHPAELAATLAGLGACLRALGKLDDALAATREAARLARDLGAEHTARSLVDLGAVLRDTGAHAEALTTSREAVQRYRDLAAACPARHIPDLAAALAGLSASLRGVGTYDETLTTTREAVRLYRDVAANSADRHGPCLARCLTDLSAVLREGGAHDEALAASREAVQRFQDLATARRAPHLPDFARSLVVLGVCLRDVGKSAAGLAASRDAVRLNRELAAADPGRHTPELARSLTDLGISLRGLRPYDEGLSPGIEAVQLSRELAAANPARHTPDLARSLTELGISLRGLAAHDHALAATGEAVQLGRDLAAAEPARHTPDLVRSLIGLGASLRALGRRPEAVLHEGEAVAWWWQLTQRRPGAFDDKYRDAQQRYFHTFSSYDHDPEDVLTAELIARSRVQSYVDSTTASEAEMLVERSAS